MADRGSPIQPLSRRKGQRIRKSLARTSNTGPPASQPGVPGLEVDDDLIGADDVPRDIPPIPSDQDDQNEARNPAAAAAPVPAAEAHAAPNVFDELVAQIEEQEYDLNIRNGNNAQKNAHQLWLDKWTTLSKHHMQSNKVTCADSLLMLFAKARHFSWPDNSITAELRQVHMENEAALPACYPKDARGFWDVCFLDQFFFLYAPLTQKSPPL